MTENADLVSIVHLTVATSKEMAEKLQDKIAEFSTTTNRNLFIALGLVETQAIASQLRITANLVAGLLEENASMLDQLNEAIARINQQ
jgi:hypothetical protein